MDSDFFYAATGYDDTPRHGRGGIVIDDMTPELYYNQLQSILSLSREADKQFVFVNAWNEWGEGMYLEPDERYGYAFLEATKKALEDLDKEPVYCNDRTFMEDNSQHLLVQRHRDYWTILSRWMELLESGEKIDGYLIKQNYKNIAIYGMGMLGTHLLAQLADSVVKVKYGIDIRSGVTNFSIPVYTLDQELADVDAIVLCVTYNKGKIKEEISKRIDAQIIELSELIEKASESQQLICD